MSESANNSLKKKRLKGLGGALWKRLEPLNDNEDFKERFRDEKITIVLNATDQSVT